MIYPCACGIFLHVFINIVTAFLVALLGNTNPSGDAKKRQQSSIEIGLGVLPRGHECACVPFPGISSTFSLIEPSLPCSCGASHCLASYGLLEPSSQAW